MSKSYPLDFELHDGGRQNVIFTMGDHQTMTLEITNTSKVDITIQPTSKLELQFRPGTLDNPKTVTIASTNGTTWTSTYRQRPSDSMDVYEMVAAQPLTLSGGQSSTFSVSGVRGDGRGGSRGTVVQLTYVDLKQDGLTEPLKGRRRHHMGIVQSFPVVEPPITVTVIDGWGLARQGGETELTLCLQCTPPPEGESQRKLNLTSDTKIRISTVGHGLTLTGAKTQDTNGWGVSQNTQGVSHGVEIRPKSAIEAFEFVVVKVTVESQPDKQLPDCYSTAELKPTGAAGTIVPTGSLFQGAGQSSWRSTAQVTLPGLIQVQAVDIGPVAAADTISTIVTPIDGLLSVTNPSAASPLPGPRLSGLWLKCTGVEDDHHTFQPFTLQVPVHIGLLEVNDDGGIHIFGHEDDDGQMHPDVVVDSKIDAWQVHSRTDISAVLNVVAEKGNITAEEGNITAKKGNITAETGYVVAKKNDIVAQAGNVIAEDGNIIARGKGALYSDTNLYVRDGKSNLKDVDVTGVFNARGFANFSSSITSQDITAHGIIQARKNVVIGDVDGSRGSSGVALTVWGGVNTNFLNGRLGGKANYSAYFERRIACEDVGKFSDARMKGPSHRHDIDDSYRKIANLTLKQYQRKRDVASGELEARHELGLIAQEVEEVIPSAVSIGPAIVGEEGQVLISDPRCVSSWTLLMESIAATQKLIAENESRKATNLALTEENGQLRQEMQQLEARMDRMMAMLSTLTETLEQGTGSRE